LLNKPDATEEEVLAVLKEFSDAQADPEKLAKLKKLEDDLKSVVCAREIKSGEFKVEFI